MEAHVKLGSLDEPILAVVDHGFEINILSRKIYEKEKWPIHTNHRWVLRATKNKKNNKKKSFWCLCSNKGEGWRCGSRTKFLHAKSIKLFDYFEVAIHHCNKDGDQGIK